MHIDLCIIGFTYYYENDYGIYVQHSGELLRAFFFFKQVLWKFSSDHFCFLNEIGRDFIRVRMEMFKV